jgi:hypothetical protein
MKINVVEGYPVTWSEDTYRRLGGERVGSYSCFLRLADEEAQAKVPLILDKKRYYGEIANILGYGLAVARMCLDSDEIATLMVCRDVAGLGSFNLGAQPVQARDLIYTYKEKVKLD